ncbi:hypothetical protein KUTeg_014747 [Tegillarca granosa]|uniref:Ig-like domain-containing protein n=1 Tax=Tegillarca granosa TaxID=220873 RepID=A0ABQ9EUT2_TEGGR|nr:hypothetical protein KUTeg_014747 [Tegillarca granosa]
MCFMITESAWTLTGSSEFAVAGESFTLTCNPQDSNAIAVTWKRLDIDTTATGTSRASVEANGCMIGSEYDPQYQYTCEPGPVYKLTIPANVMTNSQNNKIWRCEHSFGGAAVEYQIKVQVPVSSISIQADNAVNQQVNVIYENIPKTYYCITNGCRPKANVTVTTTGVTKGQLTESTTQNGDLIITRVSQVTTAKRGGNTIKTLQCLAVNIQGRQPIMSQLFTLDVYYIPSVEPTLTGYTNGTVLYEGDKDLTVNCQQSGGCPLSVIAWSCGGQTGTSNNTKTVASSYVQLTVNRNLNRKTCTCTVRHPDNYLAYTRTLYVTFTVYYTPIITLDTTNITVEEGDYLSRQCYAIGNPTPSIKWYRGNSELISGIGTSAALVFSNIDRNQTDSYLCKATATGKRNFESSKSVSVVVYYPPSVTVALQNASENTTNVVFTCNADGFPTNYTYHGWNHYIGNTLVRAYTEFTTMLSDSNRKITIPKVTFKDTGTYHCVVENGFHGRQTNVLQQGSSYFDVRESESSKYDTTSAAIGGAIGSILTLIVIAVIITVFILYRRRTNRGKSR